MLLVYESCASHDGEGTIAATTIGIRLALDFFQRTKEVVAPLNILEFPFADGLASVEFVLGCNTEGEHGGDDVGHIDTNTSVGSKHFSFL